MSTETMQQARETIETMQRVRTNLDMLVPRLVESGYRFASATPVLGPVDDTAALLQHLEERLGPVPQALCAFYTQIGGIDLLGAHPGWCPPGPLREDSPWVGLLDARRCYADPLYVAPLRELVAQCDARQGEVAELEPDEGLLFAFADDLLAKEEGQGGVYGLLLPESEGDTDVEAHCATTFVDYLRECLLSWSGFVGWAQYQNPPQEVLARLREGFLAF